jgi:hypothetical protein
MIKRNESSKDNHDDDAQSGVVQLYSMCSLGTANSEDKDKDNSTTRWLIGIDEKRQTTGRPADLVNQGNLTTQKVMSSPFLVPIHSNCISLGILIVL